MGIVFQQKRVYFGLPNPSIMKRLIAFFAFFQLYTVAQAQEKNYPDYRNKKESFTKVSDKPMRTDLASFTVGGIEESIGKLPLRKLSPTGYSQNAMSFKSDEIQVAVTLGPFDPKGRKMQLVEENLVKINGKPFYGSYGETPRTEIKSVIVTMGKDTVVIPPAAYADLYNMNFTYRDKSGTERTANAVYFSPDKKRIYIYLLSRDKTGSYEVTWVIENRQYLRRVLDYGFTN